MAEPAGRPDPCIVCACTDQIERYKSTYTGSLDEAPRYFLTHRQATARGRIVQCRECGFVFTSPRFSDGDYDRIYKTVEPPPAINPSFERANRARSARLARFVRETEPSGGRLLDFGCGDGAFLRVFDSPAAEGFEIGLEGSRRAGASTITTGDWAAVAGSAKLPPATFDVVTAFDVLEHLPRIAEDLAHVRTVLKPGGYFLASVPNIASVMARAMDGRWTMLLLEHLWYFSPTTYRRFMRQHGFEMLAVRGVPYDAPLTHLITRLSQVFGMHGRIGGGPLSNMVLPIPAGLMIGIFRKL